MSSSIDVASLPEILDKPTLNLMLLASNTAEVESLLDDSVVSEEDHQRLTRWWKKRKQRVARRLRQRRAKGFINTRQHFLGLMAELLLSPSRAPGVRFTDLLAALRDYQKEIARLRDKVERDPEGGTWRPTKHDADEFNAVQFIDLQYHEIAILADELWQVEQGWKIFKATLKPQALNQDTVQSIDNIFSILEGDRKVIETFREKLYTTRAIVTGVDNRLGVAFRTHDPNLWEEIKRMLYAYEDHHQKTPGLPIPNHRSVIWMKDAYSDLKRRREELARYMVEIEAAVAFQELEAKKVECPSNDPASSNSDTSAFDPQRWAQCFIAEQRAQGHIFLERSLLEHALQQMDQLEHKTEMPRYKRYTERVNDFLRKELENRIREHVSWGKDQTLEAYLKDAVAQIQTLRNRLVVIAGGRLTPDEPPIAPFTAYDPLLDQVTDRIQAGKFDEARALCEEQLSDNKRRAGVVVPMPILELLNPELLNLEPSDPQTLPSPPTTLHEAESRLQALAERAQQHAKLGMVQRFQRRIINPEKERLELEKARITSLHQRVNELQNEYLQCRTQTNRARRNVYRLRRIWKMKWPFRWFFRNLQSKVQDYIHETQQAYCQCLKLCPEDEWVKGEGRSFSVEGTPGCTPLPKEAWRKTYIDPYIPPSSSSTA